MKILLLGAAAAAMTLTGFAASAQSYGDHRDGRGVYDQHGSWNRSDNHRGYDQHRGYDNRYSYNQRRDWNRYARDDRDDNGLSSALAGGLLGFVLGGALSNNNASYGYAQPTYQQPYGYGGYAQPYGYSPYGYR
jgi:hypothetical protein